MKVKYALYTIIGIIALLFIILLLIVFFGVTKEVCYSGQVELNVSVLEKETDYEQIEEIKVVCSEYVESMELKAVTVTYEGYENILAADGISVFGFEKYIDNSKEGGNVRTAEVYYNSKNNTVYQIDRFEGAGKAGSLGGDIMNPEDWSISINTVLNELIDEYGTEKLKELNSPYVKIEIMNDNATAWLFSHEKDAYILEKCFDLDT